MPVYATPSDLADWLPDPAPVTVATLLARASRRVRRATITAVYDADTDGLPTNPHLRDAMRDAVCTQVATWVALGIDPVKGAADTVSTVASKSLGSASITYATNATAAQARADAATTLCPDALMILAEAGLLSWSPVAYG